MNSPGVKYPPPLWLAAGFAAGWLIETRVQRIHIAESSAIASLLAATGGILLVAGALVAAWGAMTFLRARTAILPHHAASRIVRDGPYRFTRNPMYVGLTLVYLGASLVLNTVWPFLTLAPALWGLTHFVIKREERYLAEAFGAEYSAYRDRVRRWV